MNHYHDDAIKEQQDSLVAECYRRACVVQEERFVRLQRMRGMHLTSPDGARGIKTFLGELRTGFERHKKALGDLKYYRWWHGWLLKANKRFVENP